LQQLTILVVFISSQVLVLYDLSIINLVIVINF